MYTNTIEKCLLCKAEDTIITVFSSGEVVCSECGAVLDERIIDETSEWRNFSSENPGSSSSDPNRVGGPINPYLDEINLNIMIATTKRNGVLSKWRNRSLGSGGKSLSRIFKRSEELAAKLDLPLAITEKSKDILATIEKHKKLKGRSLDCIIAAVFFQACRKCNAPRTLKDLVLSLQLEKKDVSRCFNSIKGIIASPSENRISMNTLGLVQNYCNKLGIPNSIYKKVASEVAEEVCKKEIIAGRTPSTVASSAIYYALRLYNETKITKKEIAEQSKTTENTIHSAYLELVANKESITPAYLKDKLPNLEIN
jgi:transcription initiation factor TFIIB